MKDDWFYVYVYLDPRKEGKYIYGEYSFSHEPFYVGKGSRSRDTQHISHAKRSKRMKSPKVQKINKLLACNLVPIIVRPIENVSNDYAYEKENELIGLIGRIDLNTGCLTNCNDGGKNSEIQGKELRERINNGRKKIPDFKGEKNPMFGVHRFGEKSPHYGKKHSEETKKRLSQNHMGGPSSSTSFKKGHKTWNKGTKGLQNGWNKGLRLTGKNYIFNKDGEQLLISNLRAYCYDNNLAYRPMITLHSKGYSHEKKKPHYTAKNFYKGYSNINYPVNHIF